MSENTSRLDVALTSRGLAESRTKAQSMIASGEVSVNGKVAAKPSERVAPDAEIILSGAEHYVGRGGLKLERALDAFGIDVRGEICLDAGASTGGFTDCLLKRGAEKVVAVEHGRDQLHPTLRADPRVDSREGTDIRELPPDVARTRFGFICADMSFISLRLTLPPIAALADENTRVVCLVKPQFEAGREWVGKNGVVKDKKAHIRVLNDVLSLARSLGIPAAGLIASPIRGGEGNVEYLLYARRGGDFLPDVPAIVRAALNI